MRLPVFKEIFDQNLPKFGVILCINYEHYEIKPALYDVLGEWPNGSLLYRNISSGEITDDISRYTHFAVVDHVSDILLEHTIQDNSDIILLDNVNHDIYTVDNEVVKRSLERFSGRPSTSRYQHILIIRLYEGAMGCTVLDEGRVDVFAAVNKKKYYNFTESSHDFTVFKFKDVIDVV